MSLLRRTPMPRTGTIRRISAKRQAHRASDEGKAGMAYMARVRALPCCICAEYGHRQTTATEAHHCIHGRYSARKAPDTMTIPLCAEHHRESADPAKVSLHASPAKWKRLYGEDTRWISWVEHQLGRDQ